MAIPQHILEAIKARLPLSQLVGREVSLKQRTPNDFWGLSPFASEKTPSFHVRDDQGYYHCFASGEHGNHFSWLMNRQNCNFYEALKQLADETGVELPKQDPEAAQKAEQAKSLYEVVDFVQNYYQKALRHPDGEKARTLIEERGISKDAIEYFKIGYAPNRADDLIQAAANAGYDIDSLIEIGVLRPANQENASKQPWPLLRNRLIFPIHDVQGRAIAFGGRFIGDAKATGVGKYINSPQTPLFDKSHLLYHFAPASKLARKGQNLIIAEGYMDVLALWQAGFGSAIAPLGTAVTHAQLLMIWRITDTAYFCLDGDDAGQMAAIRAATRALEVISPGKNLKFAFMEQGHDPDSLIREKGAKAMQAVLDQSKNLDEVLFDHAYLGMDLSRPEQKALLEKKIQELTNLIKDETVKRHYRYSFKDLFWQLLRTRYAQASNFGQKHNKKYNKQSPNLASRIKITQVQNHNLQQRTILGLFIHHPNLLNHYEDFLISLELSDDLAALRGDFLNFYGSLLASDHPIDPTLFHAKLQDMGHEALLSSLFSYDQMQIVPQLKIETGYGQVKAFLLLMMEEIFQTNLQKDASDLVAQMGKNIDEQENIHQIEFNKLKQFQQQFQNSEAELTLEMDRLAKEKLNGD